MSDTKQIDHGGPAFPELGNVGYNSEWQSESGMTLRDYYAAHCPMTMIEAYGIWTEQQPLTTLQDGHERVAFFDWWAQMRFEYADAMVATGGQR